jgi:hypothetical protein
MNELLSTADVAALLRKSTRFVRDEFKRRNLRGFKYGGELHFTAEDVQAYVEAHTNVVPVSPRRKQRAS